MASKDVSAVRAELRRLRSGEPAPSAWGKVKADAAASKPKPARAGGVAGVVTHGKRKPQRTLATGTGKAGVGTRITIKAPTKDSTPARFKIGGAGPVTSSQATAGVGRAVVGTAGAVAENLNPLKPARTLKTLGKSVRQAKDIAVGTGGLAALAGKTMLLPVHTAVSAATGEGAGHPAKELGDSYAQLGKGAVRQVRKDYEPLFRGEKGAYTKKVKQLEEEGITNAVLDLSAVTGGVSAGLGAGARTLARTGAVSTGSKVGRLAKATQQRPALRTGVDATKKQTVRRGVVGATAARGLDKARARRQAARVREAESKVPSRLRRVAKQPARGLPLHRTAVKPGEVAPLSDRLAAHAAKRRTSASEGDAAAKASTLSKRLVVGAKGGKDGPSLRGATKGLNDKQAAAATYATRLGIVDSKTGAAALAAREAYIIKTVAEAREKGAVSGAAQTPEVLQELGTIRELRASPEVFDDPKVRAAAQTIGRVGTAVAVGHGLSSDAARSANAELQGRHVGSAPRGEPQRARKEPVPETAAARKAADKELEVAKRAHAAARGELRHAQGRAEVLSRNVGDRTAEKEAARPVGRATFAGGGLGVRQAEAKLVETAGAVTKAAAKAAEAAKLLDTRTVPAVPRERGGDFAARVEADAAAQGLAPSGYLPSRYNDPAEGIARGARPGQGGVQGLGSKHREGTVFERGAEVHGHPAIRAAEKAHQTRLLKFERAGAVSDILEREGKAFANESEAQAWARSMNLSAKDVALIDGRTHGGVVRDTARTAGLHTADKARDLGPGFSQTGAIYLVPAAVKKELDDLAQPPGIAGRSLEKLRTVTGVSLLGLNPSWIQFQTVSDALMATAAGVTPADIARTYKLRKQMSEAGRDTLDLLSGNSGTSDILKSSDALTGSAAVFHANPVYRKFFEGKRPLTALIRADAARTGLVRDAAVLKQLARNQRTADIDAGIRAARPVQDKLVSALASKTPAELEKALKGPLAAEAGAHTAKIMGDFTHYTAAERKYLRRMLPFYGFLRFSTRLALYTLPVDHPTVGLLLAEIGRVSAEEQRAILGGDELPYALGALYNKDGTFKSDYSRANPFGNALFAGSNNSQQLSSMLPPVAVPILDAVLSGTSAFKGRKPYTFDGSTKPVQPNELTQGQQAKIWLSETLGLIPPVRLGGKIARPEPASTGDNFGIFGTTPYGSQDPEAANRLAGSAERSRSVPVLTRAAESLLPLARSSYPTQDKQTAARLRVAKEKKAQDAELKAARDQFSESPLGQLRLAAGRGKAQIDALKPQSPELEAIRRQLKLLRAQTGR